MKTVLITGGATGIGRAAAELFLQNGYEVFVTVHETPCTLARVQSVPCDLRDLSQIEALFSQFARLDVLVNNAGVSLIRQINDTTLADYEQVMQVNARAAFFCAKQAALRMLKCHSGSIINVSSVWGQLGASCEVAYSMSKAAVIGLTKALAQELAPSGITVNCVAPGIIDTRMNAPFDAQDLAQEVPCGRLGTPQEAAQAIYALTQNPYITGQVLGVNGGMV
ncbi:MAG TPA: SDR family oxidoreductase [Candidatus Scubalenecus merdavium]|uniref:SDR family oxidoreductase n=1 Tax=Candidatus Scybalenecus merdavium TaxID=2840939 RepID=A0A9D1MUW4_9FIRM|nr:SDR family oxidoreductase [Candidatus Scubalenecus merdavium]